MKIRNVMIAGALLAAMGNQADAQQSTVNIGNWYVGLQGGVFIPEDLTVHISGPVGGVATTINGTYSFDDGPVISELLGYHFNDYLAAEASFAYTRFDVSKLTGIATGALAGSFAGSVRGDVDTETLLVNALVSPFGRPRFTPFFGGGVGFTNHDLSVKSVAVSGTTIPISASDSALDFAADVVAGFDWAATDRWSLEGRYTFLWVNLSNSGCPSGATCSSDNFTGHAITIGATYHF